MDLKHGWNLAVINHRTGQIEKTSSFPTSRYQSASIKLEKFIEGIQDKRIVLGAVHIDGSNSLTPRGFRALVRTYYYDGGLSVKAVRRPKANVIVRCICFGNNCKTM